MAKIKLTKEQKKYLREECGLTKLKYKSDLGEFWYHTSSDPEIDDGQPYWEMYDITGITEETPEGFKYCGEFFSYGEMIYYAQTGEFQ